MKRLIVAMGQNPVGRSPVAQAMWGRVKSVAFTDRRKRQPKHKGRLEERCW